MVAMNFERFKFASRAMLWHLLVSLCVAALVSLVVFIFWYPAPYASMVGGGLLFAILVGVDVVCGPLLTFVVFNPVKSRRELVIDLGVIAIIQCAALGYGLQTMWHARPVYLAYELDRFYVISPSTLEPQAWAGMPTDVPRPGWTGPHLLATRVAKETDSDYADQLQLSLTGLPPVFRPDRWIPFQQSTTDLKARALPMVELYALHPDNRTMIESAEQATGVAKENIRWLPVQVKDRLDWVVLLDIATPAVKGFLPLSGVKE
ncbi:MAG TPA: hypothetical protein PK347_15150 [Burkholderiaceae bacterium]|nr:hypothetical protein [Burkholderiaceae bacterium]